MDGEHVHHLLHGCNRLGGRCVNGQLRRAGIAVYRQDRAQIGNHFRRPPKETDTSVKGRNGGDDATAEFLDRLYAIEIHIHELHAVHRGDRFMHERGFPHSALALDDDIELRLDKLRELPSELGARTVVLSIHYHSV